MREQELQEIIQRQEAISDGQEITVDLPKFKKYAVCNLRGGIGKTSLSFNLTYEAGDALAVDTCPQGNLSYFFDNDYFVNSQITVKDLILPYLIAGLGRPSRSAKAIGATNEHFLGRNAFYVASSNELYNLPSQMNIALNQIKTLTGSMQSVAKDTILYSLRDEIDREMKELELSRCLIDTSPFFAGATHLACHAVDALVVPVRADQQSINSLELLLTTLSSPTHEFSRELPSDGHRPKIQMVVLTHATWSTARGARNMPNNQTRIYIEKVRDIIARNIQHFTTSNPIDHLFILDDFLGTGRISTALSKPIQKLSAGESVRINRVKTEVNESVHKIQAELKCLSNILW